MVAIDDDVARWIADATGQVVSHAEPLVGGMSAATHRCELAGGTGVVVKHIRSAERLAREPDLITREARALDLLGDSDLPAPRHVASDPAAGLLLMSALPGRMLIDAAGLTRRVGPMAELAAGIAAVELPEGHGLAGYRSYAPDLLEPPVWGDRSLWSAGIEAFRSVEPQSSDAPHLLHRDLHPLNMLWDGDEVGGIVDWTSACVGHPHAELSHCRWNLALSADPDVADAFLDHYLATTGIAPYSGWWDLSTLMGLLPGPITVWGYHHVGRTDITIEHVIERTEEFLRRALRRM